MVREKKVSLYEFFKKFPDEVSAREWFESTLWGKEGEDRHCPRCGSVRTSRSKHPTTPYRRKDRDRHFSIRTSTLLSASRISLHKWLMAVYLLNTDLKGVSSCKPGRDTGVTQTTAWYSGHRTRKAFEEQSEDSLLSPVEMDETRVGGLERNKHASKKAKGTQGRSTKTKSSVAGIKSRVDKKVKAKVTETVKREELQSMIKETVTDGATVYTDENLGYSGLSKKGYKHETVDHSAGEYIKGQAHTNGMESFWSMLKRGFMGVYHKMSKKHLQRYVDEYAGRHNIRPLPTMDQIEKVIKGLSGKHLRYKELTS